jgi:hypothetical protein
MENICDDILIYMISFLTGGEVFILFETSKNFNRIIRNNKRIKRSFPNYSELCSSIDMIKWIQTHTYFQFSGLESVCAIINNDIELLLYLHKQNCPLPIECYRYASANSNIKLIKWLIKNCDSFPDETACFEAAKNNNLKLLKFLRDRCFPWDYNTLNIAASKGDINIVKYIIENNCDWKSEAYLHACENEDISIIKYLYSQAYNDLSKPWWDGQNIYNKAFMNGNRELVKWFESKGLTA